MVRGRLELILGNMSSGKSEYMRENLKRRIVAGYNVQLFQHEDSMRDCDPKNIDIRSGYSLEIEPVKKAEDIYETIKKETQIIGIDELHFYDGKIIDLIKDLVNSGKEVFACSLDLNFRVEPINIGNIPIYDFIPFADKTTLKNSICTHKDKDGSTCGNEEARWSQKYYGDKVAPYESSLIEAGDTKPCDGIWYAPRCREHFVFY